jgi:hypothetical protein
MVLLGCLVEVQIKSGVPGTIARKMPISLKRRPVKLQKRSILHAASVFGKRYPATEAFVLT